ncbi:MAG: hypothetical protein WKF88_00145 [Ferruginibacter sp.]
MNLRYFFIYFILFFFGCTNRNATPVPGVATESVAGDTALSASFFPVTAFLKGEIFSIRSKGVTPLKKITTGNRTDSSWVKTESLEAAFSAFLHPVIDTANLKGLFAEKKFLDQTLNAFTFSYDPVNDKAQNFAFTHWDVYVDPENNRVTRIYLLKNAGDDKIMQLTWQTGKWCKIVTINNGDGKNPVEREEKISWSYE